MRCKKCKREIDDNIKFCPYCGAKTRRRRKWPIVLVLLIVLLVLCVAFVVFQQIVNNGNQLNDPDDYTFKETVIQEIDVSSSNDIPTLRQVEDELTERGFSDVQLSVSYSLDGSFLDELELTEPTDDKYPLYNIYYLTPNGDAWVIYVCNGSYMANPLFMYSQNEKSIILSEEEYLVSYDSNTNSFIESIPDEAELTVKQVEMIDAAMLDSLDEAGVRAL